MVSLSQLEEDPGWASLPFKKNELLCKVCQGCRRPLHSSQGTVTDTPFDFCVARKEWWTYKDLQNDQLNRKQIHIINFGLHAFNQFVPCSLAIPDGLPLRVPQKTTLQKSLVWKPVRFKKGLTSPVSRWPSFSWSFVTLKALPHSPVFLYA